jgi:hypothetical protein
MDMLALLAEVAQAWEEATPVEAPVSWRYLLQRLLPRRLLQRGIALPIT